MLLLPRHHFHRVRSLLLSLLFFAFVVSARAQSSDLLLFNGHIITVDSRDSIAQALLVHDGKIAAVGSNEELRKLAPKSAKLFDLHGLTVTPGLIDTHCHFDETSVLYDITLSEVTSIKDVVDLIRKKAATLKPGEWIQGAGWDESKFAERRYLTAADLDAVAPNNPVWLQHTTGHYGVANSAALRLAKVTAETKDPEAGIIVRDSQNNPTGVLKETAMNLVYKLVPAYTHEQRRNGLLRIMADFNKEGMTAVKDPGMEPGAWQLYEELLNEKKSTVRVFALVHGGRTLDSARAAFTELQTRLKPPQSLGNGMLFSGGVKLFMDGSGGGRTAWVYEPWYKTPTELDGTNTGYPNIEPAVYREMVKLFHDAGYHVSTHAVGDRAIDTVVDTYAALLKEKPTKGLRHGIIHANIPTGHAIDTMAQLQREYDAGYPETQPPFMWWIGNLYDASFGPKREARLMPYKTYTQRNIIWAAGSDFFVTPFPARYGLWSSVVRKTLTGTQPFGLAESVDIHTALKSYTIWAAHQLFLENRVGSLEPGKDADLAVWDRDLYSIPADQLKDIKCQLTLLRGQIVYKAPDSPLSIN
jgi:predicted amidohydrolase YtcJ